MVPVSWHVHVRWHNCELHPLIHTQQEFNLAQDIESFQGKVQRVIRHAKVMVKVI